MMGPNPTSLVFSYKGEIWTKTQIGPEAGIGLMQTKECQVMQATTRS